MYCVRSTIQTRIKGVSIVVRQNCKVLETISIVAATITRNGGNNHVDVNNKMLRHAQHMGEADM